jgi:CubicO group peptidase (beta-lactamase class C family)
MAIAELGLVPVAEAAQTASLDAALRRYLARCDLPALGAAVVHQGIVIAAGVVGTRRAGTNVHATLQDRFRVDSDTKAMTALLAAMYVEQAKLRWDSTVGERFPKLVPTMNVGLQDVTLQQLLSHTSGMPSDNDVFDKLLLQSYSQPGNLDEMRACLVQQWSTQPLAAEPGTTFAYSNMEFTMRVSEKGEFHLVCSRHFAGDRA